MTWILISGGSLVGLFGVLIWALLKIRRITDAFSDAPPVSAAWQREQSRQDSTRGWTSGPVWDLEASRREARRVRLRDVRARSRRE